MTWSWKDTQRILAVLRPTWLATLIILAVAITFQVSQTLDVVRAVADKEHGFFSWQHLGLFCGLTLLAVCGWYFPRALLSVRYWNTPLADGEEELRTFEQYRRLYPRLLGSLPIISVTVAFFRKEEWTFGFLYMVLTGLFVAAVILRRRRYLKGELVAVAEEKLTGSTWVAVLVLLGVSYVLLLVFLVSPVNAPSKLGSAAIVLYAAAAWVAFGCLVLVHLTYRKRWPSLFVVLLALAALFGLWNDNHGVRKGQEEHKAWKRDPVSAHLAAWLEARKGEWSNQTQPYPIYIVSAEGGGIRAAYWTASVLARLHDSNPSFACHVFGISGVSGGSLGGAVFSSLIAEHVESKTYWCDSSKGQPDVVLLPSVRKILGKDFLSPTLAGMLFPDLLQRFWPFPGSTLLGLPDRAKYLEQAWEQGWFDEMHTTRFSENFDNLWRGDTLRYTVPSLFMNGTWVETGGRVVTSNLELEMERFIRVDDVVPLIGHSIPLSTAVHMSARFTYVSPPGTLEGKKDLPKQVVDGGYFENSGTQTAAEIVALVLHVIEHYCDFKPRPCQKPNVEPVPVIISNDLENPNNSNHVTLPPSWLHNIFTETLAPWRTLFNTRSARGYVAERALNGASLRSFRFALGEYPHADVPLGWMLSLDTREQIDSQIDGLHGLP